MFACWLVCSESIMALCSSLAIQHRPLGSQIFLFCLASLWPLLWRHVWPISPCIISSLVRMHRRAWGLKRCNSTLQHCLHSRYVVTHTDPMLAQFLSTSISSIHKHATTVSWRMKHSPLPRPGIFFFSLGPLETLRCIFPHLIPFTLTEYYRARSILDCSFSFLSFSFFSFLVCI